MHSTSEFAGRSEVRLVGNADAADGTIKSPFGSARQLQSSPQARRTAP